MKKRKKYKRISKTVDLIKKLEESTRELERILAEIKKIERFKPTLQPDNSHQDIWESTEEKIESRGKVK